MERCGIVYKLERDKEKIMITIELKKDLNKKSGKNAFQITKATSLTYPTVNRMVHGKFNEAALKTLGIYLQECGYDPVELKDAKFSDIFDVLVTKEIGG
jgi:hypothetical protein